MQDAYLLFIINCFNQNIERQFLCFLALLLFFDMNANRLQIRVYCALLLVIAVSSFFYLQNSALAGAINPQVYGSDSRFKAWTYYSKSVYRFTGYYLNPTYIEFEEGEQVSTISTPKPTAWQFVPNGNRLFLKPVEDNADTTAIIMTNKRTYFFELIAEEASGPFDPRVSFFVKFRYPVEQSASSGGVDSNGFAILQYVTTDIPDLSHPERYNLNYTMSGDNAISPKEVFDDGRFTYMRFDKSGMLPAVFAVDAQGFEELVNYRIVGDYMMIERVVAIFTLRNGADTVCVFNEVLMDNVKDQEANSTFSEKFSKWVSSF